MGGFRVDSEDWSLGAIVRGSINDFPKIEDVETNDQNPGVSNIPADDDQGFLAGFPEIFEVPTSLCDDLEDLYKQFYQAPHPLPSCTILDFQEQKAQTGDEELKAAREVSEHSSGSSSSVSRVTEPGYAPKYKRRKNHQKRVMIQVSADGITSDLWAWRKYGQKPIKGSPFPRSYYRCSSSKGCLARKQVEQSCTDPGKFIITYTAEHSHSQPTRRNSLAGTVRQKFPVTKISNESKNVNETLNQVDVVFPPTRRIKEEENHVAENEVRIKEENLEDYSDIAMPELLFDDDFFPELDELMKNSPSSTCYDSLPQLSLKSCR